MSRRTLAPLLAAALGIALTILWQLWDVRSSRRATIERHERFAQACVGAAAGVALRECRGGRYDPESLEQVFDDLRGDFGLASIALVRKGGEDLVRAGDDPGELPHSHFRAAFEPLLPRGRGRGSPWAGARRIDLPRVPLEIELVFPLAELHARLREIERGAWLTSAVLGSSILLVALFAISRIRSVALRAELASSEERLQSLEYLGRLGAGLVHETKNPLGVVRGLAERISRDEAANGELRRSARAIVDETDRTVARLDEFLLLSRPAALRRSRVPLAPLFEELSLLVAPDLEAKQATLAIEPRSAAISADLDQLRRLLLNLLLNAIEALEPGGQVLLRAEGSEDGVRLLVEDDGPGVPEALRDSLFEPYVTGRTGGTGLGLAICHRIAADHGFTLRYENRTPRGTRMWLEAKDTSA